MGKSVWLAVHRKDCKSGFPARIQSDSLDRSVLEAALELLPADSVQSRMRSAAAQYLKRMSAAEPDRAERLREASAGQPELPVPPHDEGVRGAYL